MSKRATTKSTEKTLSTTLAQDSPYKLSDRQKEMLTGKMKVPPKQEKLPETKKEYIEAIKRLQEEIDQKRKEKGELEEELAKKQQEVEQSLPNQEEQKR